LGFAGGDELVDAAAAAGAAAAGAAAAGAAGAAAAGAAAAGAAATDCCCSMTAIHPAALQAAPRLTMVAGDETERGFKA